MAEDYIITETPEGKNISDFRKVMRRLYEDNISIEGENMEGYKFKDVSIFLHFRGIVCDVRIHGDEKAKRNLISKLENTTGFVLETK